MLGLAMNRRFSFVPHHTNSLLLSLSLTLSFSPSLSLSINDQMSGCSTFRHAPQSAVSRNQIRKLGFIIAVAIAVANTIFQGKLPE